jgi:predicted phosphate transport protein (TIGR00153 family)
LNLGGIKRKLLTVGEHETFSQIEKIVELAEKANSVTAQMLEKFRDSSSMQEENQQIKVLEKEGDEASFKIRQDLLEGAVSPNILDNLRETVELADTMLDDYYQISRELMRARNTDPTGSLGEELTEFDSRFSNMLEVNGKAMGVLRRLLSASSIDEIIQLRTQIEEFEERGDDVKDGGFDKLYGLASRINYLQFIHYSELLHKFDDILDGCEDISDLVLSIVASISK